MQLHSPATGCIWFIYRMEGKRERLCTWLFYAFEYHQRMLLLCSDLSRQSQKNQLFTYQKPQTSMHEHTCSIRIATWIPSDSCWLLCIAISVPIPINFVGIIFARKPLYRWYQFKQIDMFLFAFRILRFADYGHLSRFPLPFHTYSLRLEYIRWEKGALQISFWW